MTDGGTASVLDTVADETELSQSAETVIDVLRRRAQSTPDVPCYSLVNGSDGREDLTCGQLVGRIERLSAALQSHELSGRPVLLQMSPGTAYLVAFLACLHAGVIAVPSYPPHGRRHAATQRAIRESCQPAATLVAGAAAAAEDVSALDVTALEVASPARPTRCRATAEGVAYLQYTSGSTGAPRGVTIRHRNLSANLATLSGIIGAPKGQHIVSWLPPFHDMGLVGGLLTPLFSGIPMSYLTPDEAVRRPLAWLREISDRRASVTVAPNFAFDLCVEALGGEAANGLDLSALRTVFVGAEPIRPETLTRFADAFAPYGFDLRAFYPCYGMAECTLIATGGTPGAGPVLEEQPEDGASAPSDIVRRQLVGCGDAVSGHRAVVVDPATDWKVEEGRSGEIWLMGPSVSDGYWNDPAASAKRFGGRLKDDGSGPYLRTGDLGFRRGKQIFVVGRADDVLIIRGRNIYPSDLEAVVLGISSELRPNGCAVLSLDESGPARLVVVQELHRRRTENADQLIAEIRSAVSLACGIEPARVVLVRPGAIPRTTSGKIRRRACRQMLQAGDMSAVADWSAPSPTDGQPCADEVADWLADQVQSLLARGDTVRSDVPLVTLGLDSLAILRLIEAIERRYGVTGDPALFAELLDRATLADLAAALGGTMPTGLPVERSRHE